jgi:transcriptional regulator with PAS, ATPase and Fis domain
VARRAPAPPDPSSAIAAALDELGGAAVVLDDALRAVIAAPAAERLLGFRVPRGEQAARLLCGGRTYRPVAEALAAGRAVHATIPHPGSPDGQRKLVVRSLPLGPPGARPGWLLLLDEAAAADDDGPVLFHGLWTRDAKMKQVYRVVERVAPDDVTVLVRGETGTGKELVAHAIHALSPRARGPFRAINCAALPAPLLESELFGHTRGAFTGAVRDVRGHVQLAHEGTLFLDEVGEMPLELQAKLLRVLETRTVIPVGGREPVPVDVRIVSATHRSLRAEVEAGRFRADLMYRLRVIPIFLPSLRERRGDIGLLARKLVEEMNQRSRRTIEQIAPAALRALEAYDFPGNVRELRNVMAYAYAIGTGPVLLPSDLPPEVGGVETVAPAEAPRPGEDRLPEAQRILAVLERAGGSRERAAQVLGMSRVTLWRRMRDLGLDGRRV